MKSIQNQYCDLKEGKMSQANFMRNVRMTFPHLVTNVTSFDDSVRILKNKGILSEAKTKLHPNQIHPQELRMGIKVEMEHTDDPKKAEKIALDHLAENPFYYTALKLSGVESPSAPKAKAPAKAKAKKEEVMLVDKENQMKTPKGVEKIKASANKAHKETNKGVKGVEELTHASKKAKGIKQVMSPTGGKMKTIREAIDPAVVMDYAKKYKGKDKEEVRKELTDKGVDKKIIDKVIEQIFSKPQGTNLGSSFDKFKSKLREMVQEVLNEYYDGRDNLTDISEDIYGIAGNPSQERIMRMNMRGVRKQYQPSSLDKTVADEVFELDDLLSQDIDYIVNRVRDDAALGIKLINRARKVKPNLVSALKTALNLY